MSEPTDIDHGYDPRRGEDVLEKRAREVLEAPEKHEAHVVDWAKRYLGRET